MTTPTPTAQSSACADEVHAQFVRGSEQPVSDTPRTDAIIDAIQRVLHAEDAEAYCAAREASINGIESLEYDVIIAQAANATLRVDLASAREDLADMTRQRDAALLQLAKAVEILTDIQARVREVGV